MTGRRLEILRTFQEAGEALSIGEIARKLDVHVNTVRFHLKGLTAAGQVEQVEAGSSGPGRPALMFRIHAGMDPAGPRNYRFLADVLTAGLAEAPDPAAAAIAIGYRWGLRSAGLVQPPPTTAQSVDWLVRLLAELGFDPVPETGRIAMRNCPFLDVVEPHDRVVCALHLGVLRGAAERAGAAVEITELIPFETPDRCVVTYRQGSEGT